MSTRRSAMRRRIGSVSVYQHRRSWYTYRRENGRVIRGPAGTSAAAAEITASIQNACLVASQAGLSISDFSQLC